ncbi:hypothetical protein [Halomarina rubra]|uniref:Uncharacterized protein n=1 Tax=Halomarina rubra TaxID=2071873 RepID=A0ABD6B1E2_9EURY|nr:hypothetical protein [Halomarina rubra]
MSRPPGTSPLSFHACRLCETVVMAPPETDPVVCSACEAVLREGLRELERPRPAIQEVAADD